MFSHDREFEKLNDVCETSKSKYGELEKKTTKAAEDLKHLANKVCLSFYLSLNKHIYYEEIFLD